MRLGYPQVALQVPEILLPHPGVAFESWAVIACDQYTTDPEYWRQVEELAGNEPSTLHAVFPEVHLDDPGRRLRIERINRRMRGYLEEGVLEPLPAGFVLVDRETPRTPSRKGLLVCLDLEQYGFAPGAETLIRSTEETDPERLPPRIEIRRGAPLELPHIMVLIDDPEGAVVEPLFDCRDELPLLYDFELMMGGGHLRGWHVGEPDRIARVIDALSALAAGFAARYGASREAAPLLYAVGDGNHSLAAAREVWGEARRKGAPADHPARYALVELVNLHDPGLRFEPIHRVVFEADAHQLLSSLSDYCRSRGSHLEVTDFADRQQWEKARAGLDRGAQHLPFVANRRLGIATIHRPRQQLAVASLQSFLGGAGVRHRVDYIHGGDRVEELGSLPGNVGFFTEALDKQSLFRTILRDGPLPRKSFSLGEAEEKRYYLESRRIEE